MIRNVMIVCGSLAMMPGLLVPLHAQQLALKSVDESLQDADWPWWRGPTRDGVVANANLPVRFGRAENVLWESPVPGRGHSSPIIVGVG